MRGLVAILIVTSALAGCSEPKAPIDEPDSRFDGDLGEGMGLVQGIVVDQAIVPAEGVTVRILPDGPVTQTDALGYFLLAPVPAGANILNLTSLVHSPVQVQVWVEEGGEDPPLVKVQVERLFDQQPYLVPEQFQGHIECGYAHPFGSSLCLNDYTRFIPGNNGSAPQLQETGLDDRDHDYVIEAGWQTHIVEMTWEASADSTSEYMNVIVSHFPRPATHWYAAQAGTNPVLLRMEQGVVHDNQQSEPRLVPPEGLPNMHMFAASNRDPDAGPPGNLVSLAISQDFEVFFHTFYYGIAPEGWSFLAGDQDPFRDG